MQCLPSVMQVQKPHYVHPICAHHLMDMFRSASAAKWNRKMLPGDELMSHSDDKSSWHHVAAACRLHKRILRIALQ